MSDWASATNVAYVANIAQVVATFVSAGGLVFLAKQVRAGNRAEDLKALFDFYERVEDVEERLQRDLHGADRTRVVNEFLNFVEVSCEAYLHGLYGKTSTAIVRDKLIDALGLALANTEIATAMEDGVTGPTVFSGILAFRKRHRWEIDARLRVQGEIVAPPAAAVIAPDVAAQV